MQWVIYELSRRSDIQSTLRDEVLSVVSRGTAPNAEQVQKMPYLKAFIKEVLRLGFGCLLFQLNTTSRSLLSF